MQREHKIQLSARLSGIAAMVTKGNRLVDVGCDHGYLPVFLVLNGIVPSAIAADVRKGPLLRAKEHIGQYGAADRIQTRLSDGLEQIKAGEGDTLVIAGMGGPLMERILTAGALVRDSFSEWILQPQSDIPHVRHFIQEQGWKICEEEMILEEGKFYTILKALPRLAGEKVLPWTKEEEAFGRFLLQRRHPVLREYLQRELRIRQNILDKLAAASGEGSVQRREEIEEERRLIRAALKRYEGV